MNVFMIKTWMETKDNDLVEQNIAIDLEIYIWPSFYETIIRNQLQFDFVIIHILDSCS